MNYARWGVSGALFSQSATARLIPFLRDNRSCVEYQLLVMKLVSQTIGGYEICQGWKAAALSSLTYVL